VVVSSDIAQVVRAAIAIGAGATLFTDLWNLFLKSAFGIQSLSNCLIGRWLSHMPSGRFCHENIRIASARAFECAIGWVCHYAIGVAFALAFVWFTGDWLVRPTFLPAFLYGIGTVVFPLFIMQPALGLGFASSRAPSPWFARGKSLMTHAAFGTGLYLSALLVGYNG
jgi:hypothetical protein